MKTPITIMIVEDNLVLNQTLSAHITDDENFELAGAYTNFEDAYAEIATDKPDIILMDINLPEMNGIDGTRKIVSKYPNISIIIITALENSDNVFAALSAGAIGYMTKTFSKEELTDAILNCAGGGAPMSAKIAKMVVNSFRKVNFSPLTDREKQVLETLALGYSYGSIADELFISLATVKYHIKNIYIKLQVSNRTEALREARKKKYI